MRDCVRRFAEAMDKILDEKMVTYGNPEDTITDAPLVEIINKMEEHSASASSSELHKDEAKMMRQLIHTSNLCMMGWNKVKIHG